MKTYYTVKDGKVDRIRQAGKSPGSNWKKAPVDWGGNHGDKTDGKHDMRNDGFPLWRTGRPVPKLA